MRFPVIFEDVFYSCFYVVGGVIGFMFLNLNREKQTVIDFDVRSEIVSKDKFFERAKRYISIDEKTLLYRQNLFSDILKIKGLSEFLISLSEKLTEYAPLMKPGQASNREEKLRNVLYPTVYIELVRFIYETLSAIHGNITSESLKNLYELAKSDMASFADSLVAPLSIINALLAAIGVKKKDEVAETLRQLENVWEEYHVYEKKGIAEK